MSTLKKFVAGLAVGLLSLPGSLVAQSSDDLAKQAQNPIANLISLPLQNNTNFNVGPQDRTQNILNIQPVWPFSISEDWNVITRTILPVVNISSGQSLGDGIIPTPIDLAVNVDKLTELGINTLKEH